MADTVQIVRWSLEQQCKLRGANGPDIDAHDRDSLTKAQAYSAGLRARTVGFGVFGDIYVSSYTYVKRPSGQKPGPPAHYPANGFVVSDEFREFGGPEALFAMCGNCPANTSRRELAGCCGSLRQWPESPDTEAQLTGIVSRLGLEVSLGEAFPKTTPIWYGLWAVSPVPPRSLGILRLLITEMLAEDKRAMELKNKIDADQLHDFALFVKAVELAELHGLRLHVELLPLGHTDCGIYTIFPHCPFCKASARTEQWQRRYPTARQKCEVCGKQFSPAETASAKRMNRDPDELRKTLGQARFMEFAREYLVVLGESPETAGAIVIETEAEERRRVEKLGLEAELGVMKDNYLCDRIFTGLATAPHPPSEIEGDEDKGDLPGAIRWFDANNMAVAMRRAIDAGISITWLTHHSASREMDRYESRDLSEPLAVLARWIEEGCSEKFCARFRVPDSLICRSEQ